MTGKRKDLIFMICSNCGNTTDNGVSFCPYCGKKIEDMIDLEKKSAAVNDVFASQETVHNDSPAAPVPAFGNETRQNVPPVPSAPAFGDETRQNVPPVPPVPPAPAFGDETRQNVPPVSPAPAFTEETRQNVPPVMPPPAFSREPGSAPIPPVTPVPAFNGAPRPNVPPTAPVKSPNVPPMPAQPVRTAPKKKKEFFGVGAFALCLVIIGLLSASTGIFAYLYFSLLGVL